jgi:hypothetical protein
LYEDGVWTGGQAGLPVSPADCLRPILLAAGGEDITRSSDVPRRRAQAGSIRPALANTCRRWVFTVCGEMYSHLGLAVITWFG